MCLLSSPLYDVFPKTKQKSDHFYFSAIQHLKAQINLQLIKTLLSVGSKSYMKIYPRPIA